MDERSSKRATESSREIFKTRVAQRIMRQWNYFKNTAHSVEGIEVETRPYTSETPPGESMRIRFPDNINGDDPEALAELNIGYQYPSPAGRDGLIERLEDGKWGMGRRNVRSYQLNPDKGLDYFGGAGLNETDQQDFMAMLSHHLKVGAGRFDEGEWVLQVGETIQWDGHHIKLEHPEDGTVYYERIMGNPDECHFRRPNVLQHDPDLHPGLKSRPVENDASVEVFYGDFSGPLGVRLYEDELEEEPDL